MNTVSSTSYYLLYGKVSSLIDRYNAIKDKNHNSIRGIYDFTATDDRLAIVFNRHNTDNDIKAFIVYAQQITNIDIKYNDVYGYAIVTYT